MSEVLLRQARRNASRVINSVVEYSRVSLRQRIAISSFLVHVYLKNDNSLEMVQRRAARWTLNRHHNTSSVKGMLEDLQWRTLEQRRTDCRLVLLIFQIIHGLVQIPPTNYLQPSLNTTSRKNHNYTYQQCSTRTNYLKYSFFPYTTVVWNNLPYQLVNSPGVI